MSRQQTWADIKDKQWHERCIFLGSVYLRSGRYLKDMRKLLGIKQSAVYNLNYDYKFTEESNLVNCDSKKHVMTFKEFKAKQWNERKAFLDKVYKKYKDHKDSFITIAEKLEINCGTLHYINTVYKFYKTKRKPKETQPCPVTLTNSPSTLATNEDVNSPQTQLTSYISSPKNSD